MQIGLNLSLPGIRALDPAVSVRALFINDEPGTWFEANDSTTLFTDVAGTTPVTTPGDAVALQLDKSGRGNHRTQATTAARPLYALHPVGGVRNKLQYTEEFDNAAWSKVKATVTANATASPDGTTTADKLADSGLGGTNQSFINFDVTVKVSTEYTFSCYLKEDQLSWCLLYLRSFTSVEGGVYFNLSSGVVGSANAGITGQIENVGGGWYRCSVTFTSDAVDTTGAVRIYLAEANGDSTVAQDGASSIFIYGAQLEEGSTATNYQRVGSFLDVSEEGKARRGRIWYNGTSHFMQTGTITPGTDKVQVFAGVRKLSDAVGMVVELSSNWAVNQGSLSLQAGTQTGSAGSLYYYSSARGDASATTTQGGEWQTADVSPDTAVLTGTHDIAGDLSTIRRNGVAGKDGTADKGTGNFLAYPLYFGARGGTSLFFNGYEDTSIIRFGPNLDADTISKVESYVASKTPESTL